MAYFNHAFRKCFVIGDDQLIQDVTLNSSDLVTGANGPQFAFLNADTYAVMNAAAFAGYTGNVMLAQSSFHNPDTIGNNPGHGGYMESTKSKGINPAYVSKIWVSPCCTLSQSTTTVCVGADCAPCGSLLYLRMDVKGSPALRFLNHNAYAYGDSSGDAAANGGPLPGICCATDQTYLDPAMALAAAAQMLLADPLISPFARECQSGTVIHGITATNTTLGNYDGIATIIDENNGSDYEVGDLLEVTGGGGAGGVVEVLTAGGGAIFSVALIAAGTGYTAGAGLATTALTGIGTGGTVEITLVDADTGSFSIDEILNGSYVASLDPVADGVTACACFEGAYVETKFGDCSFDTRDHYNKEPVQLTLSVLDETGDPCNDCGTTTSVPGCMGQTSGETVLREILMTEQYMQNPYNQGNPDSARIREIEGSDDVLANINRLVNYKQYNILHSIPRFNNPTGVFDNDQYLYSIYVECTDTDAQGDLITLLDLLAGLTPAPITVDTTDVCG